MKSPSDMVSLITALSHSYLTVGFHYAKEDVVTGHMPPERDSHLTNGAEYIQAEKRWRFTRSLFLSGACTSTSDRAFEVLVRSIYLQAGIWHVI